MGIVYYRASTVKFRCFARPRHSPFVSPRIKKLVVVGPGVSVENSRSEFSKRLWGTWSRTPPGGASARFAACVAETPRPCSPPRPTRCGVPLTELRWRPPPTAASPATGRVLGRAPRTACASSGTRTPPAAHHPIQSHARREVLLKAPSGVARVPGGFRKSLISQMVVGSKPGKIQSTGLPQPLSLIHISEPTRPH